MGRSVHIIVPIQSAKITETTVDIVIDENAVITEY